MQHCVALATCLTSVIRCVVQMYIRHLCYTSRREHRRREHSETKRVVSFTYVVSQLYRSRYAM